MASTRLPRKPLAEIAGEAMIVHVWRRALEADLGRVVVATDSDGVAEVVRAAGGEAVMTRDDHASGSDRIFEALGRVDPEGRHDIVVNVQGDLPTIEPATIRAVLPPLSDPRTDIATLAAVITRAEERDNPNVVKAVGAEIAPGLLRALYFTRATAPWGEGDLLHHIGLYAYRRQALERFETRERLEQLRALEAGMRIDIAVVPAVPLGVDTPHDLARAKDILEGRSPT
jgi:3-deoxy-manno-octulosonate cytidylyltransferase (CMP-KDO synthetase)